MMTSWNDTEYFRRRSAFERGMAQAADHPKAAAVHQELAERYEALVKAGKRPTLRIATANASEAA
jgi:hypothetical protein